MRALWLVRRNLTQHPGGDTTQILRTADALRAQGVNVELCSDERPNMAGYDVVHLFHLDRLWEHEPHCRQIRAQRRPAVLSTIYWPPDEFDRGGRAGFQGLLARMAGSRVYENARLAQRRLLDMGSGRWRSGLSPRGWSFRRTARLVLESVRVLLPNSNAERQQIEQRFDVRRPAVVVPNGVDLATFASREGAEAGRHDQRQGVLCVGRIEPRKNQLALIRALSNTGIRLTFVGQSGRFSGAYGQRCHQAAGPNVEFVAAQPPQALRGLYAGARVHACVSWYETPGLASLEAAVCGCALVLTPGGSTREYFRDEASYCEPDRPETIRRAVEAALAAKPGAGLAERVAREYTWEAAAERTLAGYRLALES